VLGGSNALGTLTFLLRQDGFFSQTANANARELFGYRLDRSIGPIAASSWVYNNASPGAGISFTADDGAAVSFMAGGQGTAFASVSEAIPTHAIPTHAPLVVPALAAVIAVTGLLSIRRLL
jgi:hypothetical protein